MVSACLLHQSHSPPGKRLDVTETWQAPATGIERLLELSKDIPLEDGEVTPVQAWYFIRGQVQYADLEITRLEDLKKRLLKHVKCYG